jgi:hypothetical protein
VANPLVGSVVDEISGVDDSAKSKVAGGIITTALEVEVSVIGWVSRFSGSLWQPYSVIKHRARISRFLLFLKIFPFGRMISRSAS